jgi:DNA (cytosine-5)-methyltransferase 1
MKYLSVCSGIEAATVAWHQMGWEPVGFSEIEKFPSQVLAHHYPNVPNLGDMTKYKEWNIEQPDLLVGGTPCQSFSVAGLRKGLEDPRGNLALVYCGILNHYRPKWFVWENVPGVLSSNRGRDFGSFLGALAQLGYGFAYRVLDAQYWGVAQRRKRVFVVGCLGDWRPAAAVLFESKGLSRDTQPSREKGQTVANCLTKSPSSHSGANPARGEGNCILQPVGVPDVMATLLSSTAEISRPGNAVTEHETYIPMAAIPLNSMNCFRSPEADPSTGCGVGEEGEAMFTISKTNHHAVAQPIGFDAYNNSVTGDVSKTLDTGQYFHHVPNVMQPIAFHATQDPISGHVSPSLGANMYAGVTQSMAVRRLTPVECERLQGFPDNYTNIKENCPDGPRYKALGNSMAVPVMKWIGERINET